MRDSTSSGEGLALQAFLYASGELDPGEATSFEQRLGEDQAAREALSQAVQLTLVPLGFPPGPSTGYRQGVLCRLRPRPFKWFFLRPASPGHPAFWITVGAVAAVLVTLYLNPIPAPTPGTAPEPIAVLPPDPPPTVPGPEPEPAPVESTEADVAEVWAELNNSEHMARAHEEEMRRRARLEERSRMMRGEDHRSRVLHNTSRHR